MNDQVLGMNGIAPIGRVPALSEIVKLLNMIAGDPRTVDKAIVCEQFNIDDTQIFTVPRLRANTEAWSILILFFSQASGSSRFLITGGDPTAAGFGVQVASGGGSVTIRGVDNINNFKIIAESGNVAQVTALMFKAQAWNEIAR